MRMGVRMRMRVCLANVFICMRRTSARAHTPESDPTISTKTPSPPQGRQICLEFEMQARQWSQTGWDRRNEDVLAMKKK